MVTEMRKTRELSILPKLGLRFHRLGPTAMTVAIASVGPGPALAIDVTLIYEPSGSAGELVERRWRQPLLASGEQRDFMPAGELNDSLNGLTATYSTIRLKGTMQDAAGTRNDGLIWPHCDGFNWPHFVRSSADDLALIERGSEAGREWDPEWSSSSRSDVTVTGRACRSGRLPSATGCIAGR
jgi:hypothetical protein